MRIGDEVWQEPESSTAGAWRQIVAGALAVMLLAGVIAVFALTRESEEPRTESAPAPVAVGGLDPADIQEVIPADGIPSIDEPRFVSVSDVDFLTDKEPVIALELEGVAKAYPLQIMTWHEIVNDSFGDRDVAVTFCPLCNTAVAFERPVIEGDVTTFGTSGKLINSNLLMYDRATESLWPQATGVALTGPQKGAELERFPAAIVPWGEFEASFPDGEVLSLDTGFDRPYGENPYPGYDDVDSQPFLFTGEIDGRLAAVERVLGVQVGDALVAYPYFKLEDAAVVDDITAVNDEVGGEAILVVWKKGTASALDKTDISGSRDVGAAAAFSRTVDGEVLTFEVRRGTVVDTQTGSGWDLFGRAVTGPLKGERLERAQTLDSFWFDWAAFHPETEIWEGR